MAAKLDVFVESFHRYSREYEDPSVAAKLFIQRIFAEKLPNNFVCVCVDWKSGAENKNAEDGAITFSYSEVSKKIEFPNLKYKFRGGEFESPAFIEIGLQLIDEETGIQSEKEQINYTFLFWKNTKYGAAFYFAPKNWADGENEILVDAEHPNL
jgi:hypothetical protein